MKEIGKLIQALRKEHHMTQEHLAEKIGVTKQTISNYEGNKRRPDYEELEAICDTFNVPMGFFLTNEEQKRELNEVYAREGISARISIDTKDTLRHQQTLDAIINQLMDLKNNDKSVILNEQETLLIDAFRHMTTSTQRKFLAMLNQWRDF